MYIYVEIHKQLKSSITLIKCCTQRKLHLQRVKLKASCTYKKGASKRCYTQAIIYINNT